MKILVTGASGNPVATWLAEHLKAKGHELRTYLANWSEPAELVTYDLIIHGDELRGRYSCRAEPIKAAKVNVGLTASLARAAAAECVPFVYLSSGEAAIGADLYGLTKLAGEQAAALYARQTGCQIIRLNGVYGPGLGGGLDEPQPNRFLGLGLQAKDDGLPYAAHEQVRRGWTYVSDAVRAIRLIVEDGRPGSWNVGRWDNELSMFDLARAAFSAAGADPDLVLPATFPPDAPDRRTPDTAALGSLGWAPSVELEYGLEVTAAWPGHSRRLPTELVD